MGVLRHEKTGTEHTLSARVVIGRSGTCTLRLHAAVVSGEHATLSWNGVEWELRDLGSSNGTWLADRRLRAGERATLDAGARVGFGTRSDPWALVDHGPPTAVARPVPADRGAPVRADGGLLPLPSAEAPEKVLLELEDGQWVLESDSQQVPVANLETVEVGGVLWRLYLPVALARTAMDGGGAPTPPTATLSFAVSSDEEYVELTVIHHDGRATRLKSRTYHYMLLTLARQRTEDAAQSPRERGWIYLDELARQLAIDTRTVNVYVMRARQQLAKAGVAPTVLIERRPGPRIRLGPLAFEIARL